MKMIFVTSDQAKDPIAFFAKGVSAFYCQGFKQFVGAGVALEHAIAGLKKRDQKNWKHAYRELLQRLNMPKEHAEQLRSIAYHPVLADPRYCLRLPANWATLRELARLPAHEVKKRIASGDLTPQTKASEVKKWKAGK